MFWQQYIIIDDFYPDPIAVRDMALTLPLEENNHGNYAGKMSQIPWFSDGHRAVFSRITGEALERSEGLCGYFRFTKANEKCAQYIHFDPKPGQVWAGLVYLSDQKDIDAYETQYRCGTAFWRHNRTGLEKIPLSEPELADYGWNSTADLKKFLDTEGLDESLWTQTFYVPAKFNRLVLFRPWMFHSPGFAFGDTLQNCRLVQLFFLKILT